VDHNETGYHAPLRDDIQEFLGGQIDLNNFGTICYPHDADSNECSNVTDCTSIVPLPIDCDLSWCERSWCYIDPNKCSVDNTPSHLYKNTSYSYATCGEVNRLKHTERIRSLKGKTFQVGYASNSGGWKGAYNYNGSFATNNLWRGPTVDFIRQAALVGGFRINITAPPEKLVNKSKNFFGNSEFDLCVYAVSLGYLDFCVGGFTINEKRSSVTTMYQAYSDPMYLISFVDLDVGASNWESFYNDLGAVFRPFTLGAWMMILLFALPVLGMIMMYHEYDQPGSSYPKNEPDLIEKDDGIGNKSTKVAIFKIPLYKPILNSLYRTYLSFFSGSYEQSVVTIGGKINLLGISSFIMFLIAVYTANLASILTQEATKVTVESVEMAIRQGMNICASRNKAHQVIQTYGIDPKHFVPDLVSEGGDGQPGFVANGRERTFNLMRRNHNDRSLYCNVAIANVEDLEIMHQDGKHCNKVKVGDSIAYNSIGIPINDGIADQLVSLFHAVKSKNVMAKALLADTPISKCPIVGGEGTSINVQQLTGVWIITFSFAILSLASKCLPHRHYKKRIIDNSSQQQPEIFDNVYKILHMFRGYDQWGNGTPMDEIDEGFKYGFDENELIEV